MRSLGRWPAGAMRSIAARSATPAASAPFFKQYSRIAFLAAAGSTARGFFIALLPRPKRAGRTGKSALNATLSRTVWRVDRFKSIIPLYSSKAGPAITDGRSRQPPRCDAPARGRPRPHAAEGALGHRVSRLAAGLFRL